MSDNDDARLTYDPRATRRQEIIWGVLSLVLIPLAWGGGAFKTTVVAAAWALLVGVASSGGLALGYIRDGTIRPDASASGAPEYRLASTLLAGLVMSVFPAVLSGGVAWVVASRASPKVGTVAFVVGGLLTPLVVGRLKPPPVFRPRSSTRLRHIIDTALPTALLAGPFGTLILWTRLPVSDFSDGALLRHFIGSTLLYALLLGLATAMKAWTEVAWGLVNELPATRRPPHPLLFGAALCGVWSLLPVGALDDRGALLSKLIGGFSVAMLVGAVGAVRGQENARQHGQQGRRQRR